MATIPNTNDFFNKTAYYASAARTTFQLQSLPPVKELYKETFSKSEYNLRLLDDGFKLLKEGILAKSTVIPTQSLITDTGFSYGGPTRKHPLVQQFNNIDVEFWLMGETIDKARALHFTISTWIELIAGPRNISASEIPRSDSTAFAVQFYDNYTTDAKITIGTPASYVNKEFINEVGTLYNGSNYEGELGFKSSISPNIITIKLSELYPLTIGSMFTTWENQDAPLSMPVTFCYYYAKTVIED